MKFQFILLLTCASAGVMAQFNNKNNHSSQERVNSFREDLYIPTAPAKRSNGQHLGKAVTIPLILTAASFYSVETDHEHFSKYELKEERDEHLHHFHSHIDDYLQYAPIAVVYGLDFMGVKAKNDFANRTALLIKSELIMMAITYPLKKIAAEPRPDTGALNSFPSGHTAQAFAAATFMAKEYGHKSPWYTVGAYTIATSVGAMRMLNDRHWLNDVLAGAASGIFSTNMAYLTHRYKWGNKKKTSHQTLVVPSYDGKNATVSVVARLN
jgi:membrane-associated phospholipid phosphatase